MERRGIAWPSKSRSMPLSGTRPNEIPDQVMVVSRPFGMVYPYPHPNMKRKPISSYRIGTGFTLVELLVVIVIIAALAAVAFSVGPRMIKRGKAAKSVQNIRQIGSLFGVYAAENSSTLPAQIAIAKQPDGKTVETLWYVSLLSFVYPDVDFVKFSDKNWWSATKPVVRNPLLPDSRFQPWFNGYAMNASLAYNTAPGRNGGSWGDGDGPESAKIRLTKIPDPGMTPLASTTRNWFYGAGDLTALTKSSSVDKALLVDGKVPVLFVDGHVESMAPLEYVSRKLSEMPRK